MGSQQRVMNQKEPRSSTNNLDDTLYKWLADTAMELDDSEPRVLCAPSTPNESYPGGSAALMSVPSLSEAAA